MLAPFTPLCMHRQPLIFPTAHVHQWGILYEKTDHVMGPAAISAIEMQTMAIQQSKDIWLDWGPTL